MITEESEDDLWNEFLIENGCGNVRRTPDGRRMPY
jgi:hypothetical protein